MKIEDYSLKTSEDDIPWRLFTPSGAGSNYCVLWLQGWSSSMDSHKAGVERMSSSTGIVFATLDPSGHGLHKLALAQSTRKQQLDELVAIFDQLKERGYKKIIVIGGSFGGYMSALLTAERPVHAAVLRCPANYPDSDFTLKFEDTSYPDDYASLMRTKGSDEILKSSMATKAIQNYDGFVYILEHELDEIVPAKVPKRYFEVAKHGNYLIVPKTKHSPKLMPNPEKHFEYIEDLVIAIIEAIMRQDQLA